MSQPQPSYQPRRSTRSAPYSATEARQILQAARATGLTLWAYAKRHELESSLLYWWRAKLSAGRAKAKPHTPPLTFVPLVVTPPESPAVSSVTSASGIELRLGDITLRLQRGFCDETLRRALAVVAGRPSC